jgi:hypothetical protein
LSGKGKKESSNARKNHRKSRDALCPYQGLLYGISAFGVNWNVGMKSEGNLNAIAGSVSGIPRRSVDASVPAPTRIERFRAVSVSKRQDRQRGIDCHRCIHYYVTWDRQFPHGCRAMEFKGRRLPAATVRGTSGVACLLYEEKPPPKKMMAQ